MHTVRVSSYFAVIRYKQIHDDVIKWEHFPRYWPFVRGIHRSPVNSPHKGQWRGALMLSLICALNKRLSKQSLGWWFETSLRSLWRHCNVTHFLRDYLGLVSTGAVIRLPQYKRSKPKGYGWIQHIVPLKLLIWLQRYKYNKVVCL